MSLYHIQLAAGNLSTLERGQNAMIVTAESAAEAKLAAQAGSFHPSDAAWDEATVTALADVTDLAGWRAKVDVTLAGTVTHTATVTAVTPGDFDSIGDLLAAAFVDLGLTATYATPDLEIATIGDGIGDSTVTCQFLPPTTWNDSTVNFPAFYGTVTDEGVAGAILNVVLNDVIAPGVLYKVKS